MLRSLNGRVAWLAVVGAAAVALSGTPVYADSGGYRYEQPRGGYQNQQPCQDQYRSRNRNGCQYGQPRGGYQKRQSRQDQYRNWNGCQYGQPRGGYQNQQPSQDQYRNWNSYQQDPAPYTPPQEAPRTHDDGNSK